MLGRIHAAGVTAITILFALFRMGVGVGVLGGCVYVWPWASDLASSGIDLLVGVFAVWGLVMVVLALGVFVGAPSPERNARRETRRALRRARMTRRW
jgi:uncharacterized membrane protein